MAPIDKKKAPAAAKERPHAFKNPVVYGLSIGFLVLSIAAFVWVPAARRGGMGARIVFGTYGDQVIDYKQGNYLSRLANQINQQNKDATTSQDDLYAKAHSVWRQAFEQTALRMAILGQAKSAGYVVSQDRLDKEMAKLPAFEENGKFSLALFRAMSQAERAQMMDSLREDLTIQDYQDDVQNLLSSPGEAEFVKKMNGPERTFSFVSFPFSAFPDSEVKAFGAENKDLFRSIKVSYLKTAGAKADLEKLRATVVAGKDSLEKLLAKEGGAYSGVENVMRAAWEMKDYFTDEKDAKAVMALKQGEYSPVLKSRFGEFIFYYCAEPAADPDFSNQDTVSKAWSYMKARERGKIETFFTKRGEAFAAAAAGGFDKACKDFAVKANKLGPFPVNFGGMPLLKTIPVENFSEISLAGSDQAFLEAAFGLKKKGDLSKPQVMADSVVVQRFDEEAPADESTGSVIDYYYGYYVQQYADGQVKDVFLKSKRFKDTFEDAFNRYIMPKQNG
jgi:peptidyl-prolyl cis-trans isomerase D